MRISKNPEARRQEIIEIATGLFIAHGISKTSISDVAQAVGVAKGLVYYYFASKEDLVQCIVKQLATGVDQALQAILDKPELNFYKRLSAIIDYYFKAIPANQAIDALTPGDPGVFAMIRDLLSGVALKHAGKLLQQGIDEKILHILYPEHMLRILINGLGDLYIDGMTDPDIHVVLIEQMLGIEKGKLNLVHQA